MAGKDVDPYYSKEAMITVKNQIHARIKEIYLRPCPDGLTSVEENMEGKFSKETETLRTK